MKIIHAPDERLRRPTFALRPHDIVPALRELVERMGHLMVESRGIGLAAPQVDEMYFPIGSLAPEIGSYAPRLFIVDGRCVGKEDPVVFINPELLLISDETDVMVEGCLSCPGVEKEVRRSKSVVCRARDINFDVFEVDSNGLYARVIQHEFDHLYGKLIAE